MPVAQTNRIFFFVIFLSLHLFGETYLRYVFAQILINKFKKFCIVRRGEERLDLVFALGKFDNLLQKLNVCMPIIQGEHKDERYIHRFVWTSQHVELYRLLQCRNRYRRFPYKLGISVRNCSSKPVKGETSWILFLPI